MLNNGGYTVERLIYGKEAFYNEVAILDYSLLGKTLGPSFESKYHGPIKTCGELSSLLEDPNLGNVGCLEVRLHLIHLDLETLLMKRSWLNLSCLLSTHPLLSSRLVLISMLSTRPRLSRDPAVSRVLNGQSNRCMGAQDGNGVDFKYLVLFTSSAQPIFDTDLKALTPSKVMNLK